MAKLHKSLFAGKTSQLVAMATLGIAASTAIYGFVRHLEDSLAKTHFLQVANQRLDSVKNNVVGAMDTVSLLASYFESAGSNGTSRRAFSTFVKPALANQPYLQALEWIPRVKRGDRSKYEQSARLDGIQNFRFMESGSDGTLHLARQQDEYFPVFYVEPMVGNKRALGYDLASNPVRLAALMDARETGRTVTTARVKLVQEKSNQYGVLVFAPVYNQPTSNSILDRQAVLKGFALGVLRIGDFVTKGDDETKQLDQSHLLEIYLFDMSAAEDQRQLYPSTMAATAETLTRSLHGEERLQVGGRNWLLVATPGTGFTNQRPSVSSFIVLLAGLLATSVYLLYFKRKIDQFAQTAKFAEEIEAAKQRLEKSNQRFLALFEGARDAIVVFDSASETTLDVNLAAEKLTRRPKYELVGLHYTGIITDVQRTSAEVTLRQVLCNGGGAVPFAAAIITSDQEQIPVEISANWIEIDGKCVVQAIIRDVGQRKRAEAELHRVNRALSTLSKCAEALVL